VERLVLGAAIDLESRPEFTIGGVLLLQRQDGGGETTAGITTAGESRFSKRRCRSCVCQPSSERLGEGSSRSCR
jgi:hypothetical protein